MRVTIFDDSGNELANGSITDLKLDGRSRRVDISAKIIPTWRPLPEGGRSASVVTAALMDHLIESGKIEVSYSRPVDVVSVRSVGL